MTLSLDAIKAEQTRLAEKIAAFEAQLREPRTVWIRDACIILNPGEEYAGPILGKNGARDHYLILLPGELEKADWKEAMEWAVKQGGEYIAGLPTRREQALLYANLKEHFKEAWYWSGEQHASISDIAWGQNFFNGNQISYGKSSQGRARAVRRLSVL